MVTFSDEVCRQIRAYILERFRYLNSYLLVAEITYIKGKPGFTERLYSNLYLHHLTRNRIKP